MGLVAGVGAVADIAIALGNQDAAGDSERLNRKIKETHEKWEWNRRVGRMKTTTREGTDDIADCRLPMPIGPSAPGQSSIERPNGYRLVVPTPTNWQSAIGNE